MSPYFRPNKKGKARLAAGAKLTAIRRAEYGTFAADYYDTSGHRRRLALRGCTTWEEAKKLEAELRTVGWKRAHGLKTGARRSLDVSALCDAYWEGTAQQASRGPMKSQLAHLCTHFGRRSAAEVTPADCEGLLSRMARDGYAQATVRMQYVRSRLVWQYGVEKLQALEANPWDEVTPPALHLRAPRYLEPEQFQRLLAAATGRFRLLVLLAGLTGMRRGELAALTWGDFLWDVGPHGSVRVARSWGRTTPKGKRERTIPLHPALRAALDAERGEPAELLFPAPRRGGLRHSAWHTAKQLRALATRAGVTLPEGFTFHDLRKTFGTWLLKGTGNLVAAQRLLGHSTPRITEAVYLGHDTGMLAEAVAALRLVPTPADGHNSGTRAVRSVASTRSTPKKGQ